MDSVGRLVLAKPDFKRKMHPWASEHVLEINKPLVEQNLLSLPKEP